MSGTTNQGLAPWATLCYLNSAPNVFNLRMRSTKSNLVGYVRWDAQSDRFPPCQTIIPTAFRSQSELPVVRSRRTISERAEGPWLIEV
jgi:hypothetical protein